MSNTNAPFGLRATQSLGAANSQVNEYLHAAADGTGLFLGDSVITTGVGASANIPYPDGTPIVSASGTVTTGSIRGAVAGVRATLSNLSLNYCPVSTLLGILVHDDPFQLFEIQDDGTALASDDSANISIITGAGSTYTGDSGYQAHEAGETTSANVLRIIRLAPIVGNLLGANSVLQVKINNHELLNSSGT